MDESNTLVKAADLVVGDFVDCPAGHGEVTGAVPHGIFVRLDVTVDGRESAHYIDSRDDVSCWSR